MSKNTASSKFRKVNVDKYDDEAYVEQDENIDESNQGPNEAEVNQFLAQSKNTEALMAALKCPPVGIKNQMVKNKSTQMVTRVLMSFKSNEIDSCVKSLDSKSLDLLMKYIYKGFEFPSEGSSATLLTWHDKVFNIGGQGCIIRVLTDKKRL